VFQNGQEIVQIVQESTEIEDQNVPVSAAQNVLLQIRMFMKMLLMLKLLNQKRWKLQSSSLCIQARWFCNIWLKTLKWTRRLLIFHMKWLSRSHSSILRCLWKSEVCEKDYHILDKKNLTTTRIFEPLKLKEAFKVSNGKVEITYEGYDDFHLNKDGEVINIEENGWSYLWRELPRSCW